MVGDCQANRALWHIVITRLASDPRTQAYLERRVKDDRSKREAIRMLKRYVARGSTAICLALRSPAMNLAHTSPVVPTGLTCTRYAGSWSGSLTLEDA